jgi:hypothetical protein
MKKVTFKSIVKVKVGRKMVQKEFINIEYTEADDQAIRTRAMALNWQLVSIEPNKGV